MTTSPIPRPPLDRAALERVLARAGELQGQSASSDDTVGAMSDDQIVELGKEVGLTPDALRQAIAEERGRVMLPQSRGLTGGWLGAATLTAARVAPGTPASVLDTLDSVMRGELSFDVKRRFPDRMQWEPRRGFFDVMRSQLARTAEGLNLRLAEDVGASVVAVDAQRTHVSVDATLAHARSGAISQSVTSVLVSVPLGALFIVMGFASVVMAPATGAVALAGILAARENYRRRAMRVATALEQLLDRLEFGAAPTRVRGIVDKLLG